MPKKPHVPAGKHAVILIDSSEHETIVVLDGESPKFRETIDGANWDHTGPDDPDGTWKYRQSGK